MIKFTKQILRIILAIPLCILSMKLVELNGIFKVLLFTAIYVLVSLLIEPIFDGIEKRQQQKNEKNENKS